MLKTFWKTFHKSEKYEVPEDGFKVINPARNSGCFIAYETGKKYDDTKL